MFTNIVVVTSDLGQVQEHHFECIHGIDVHDKEDGRLAIVYLGKFPKDTETVAVFMKWDRWFATTPEKRTLPSPDKSSERILESKR